MNLCIMRLKDHVSNTYKINVYARMCLLHHDFSIAKCKIEERESECVDDAR